LRLWGKVIGSEKDYYIIEGQAEPRGTGANKWTFWAATELTGDWTELPLITPAQLRTSRKIKHIFTGDLGRTVLSNPLFPGKESHLVQHNSFS
jgi:hypothetical protein